MCEMKRTMCHVLIYFLTSLGVTVAVITGITVAVITEKEYRALPRIFDLDDYYECRANQKLYCKVDIQLSPKYHNETSVTWKIIQKTKMDIAYYDHSVLHHGICINTSSTNLSRHILEEYEKQYLDSEMNPGIRNIKCIHPSLIIDVFDGFILMVTLVLNVCVVVATLKDFMPKYIGENASFYRNGKGNQILKFFSLKKNWEFINKTNKKYAFVEGMRTITMIIIILMHGILAFMSLYTENPNFLEHLMTKLWFRGGIGLVWFIVQIFFLLSAMLLVFQIMGILEANGSFTLHDVFLVSVNRFLRLLPALVFIIGYHASHIPQIFGDGVLKDIVEKEYNTCRSNWYLTAIFLNNLFHIEDMCVLATWYLAVDTQLYMVAILLFYISTKLGVHFYYLTSFMAIIAIIFNSIWNYSQSYPVAFSVAPKSVTMCQHLKSEQFSSLYLSTHSNISSYMIGLILGMICMETRSRKSTLTGNLPMVVLWYMVSLGLPLFSVALTLNEYSRLMNAILGSIVKPLYTMGFAVMVFGMMENENLTMRKFFEWKPIVFLGNFTYSTYLYHFAPVLGKFARFTTPIHVNSFILIGCFILDLVSSYAIGVFMFFILELPAHHIQKRFIPNVKKMRQLQTSEDSPEKTVQMRSSTD